nr:glycosyltransferase family 2 protein [Microcella alkalica]
MIPLRWNDDGPLEEFTAYLREIALAMPVTVVDGSPEALWRHHREVWSGIAARHLRAPGRTGNGKTDGVLAGLAVTTAVVVVIADDDVRWGRAGLTRALSLLDGAAIVRPQNVFDPLPWHARWDTARSLINRSMRSDYPGTLVLRRAALPSDSDGAPHYDGDALFENLELIRTVIARGGREVRADDLFVQRRPPTVRRFIEQRVRQAYDSGAQPWRLAVELAVLPSILLAERPLRRGLLVAAATVLLAEIGLRRAHGREVFPASSAAWAPLWGLERMICAWIAVLHRAAGGMPYRGRRLRLAAHSVRHLRRAHA